MTGSKNAKKIIVHHNHFNTPEQAYDEIEIHGLAPVEMDVPAVRNESHWHDFSTWIYVLKGELKITDVVNNRTHTACRGSRVDVPARVLHHEDSKGYTIVAGMSVDPATLTGPIDLDPSLLHPHS